MKRIVWLCAVLFAGGMFGRAEPAEVKLSVQSGNPVVLLAVTAPGASPRSLELNVQRRDSAGHVSCQPLALDPTKTAIVVIDMWNSHPDPVAATRVHSLVPRMNQTLDVARQLGLQVIFAPSDVLGAAELAGSPRRAAVLALPIVPKPGTGTTLSGSPPYCSVDPSGNRTMGISPGVSVPALPGPTSQDPDLIVRNDANDWIVKCNNSQELWNVMAHMGVTTLLYMGVHLNWCVWGRDSGILKAARELNVQPILVRDLTDAYSGNGKNPGTGAADYSWSFDRGTREVVAWFEQHAFGTINASQLLARDASGRYDYCNRVVNEPGLLAYWRMDAKNGDKQIRDVTTTQTAWNAEHVALGQPGAIRGDPDTAAKFDGTTGVIVAPRYQSNLPLDVPAGNSPLVNLSQGSFSVEAWVQVDKLSGQPQWVVAHDDGTNPGIDFLLGLKPDGRFEFATRQNKANDAIAKTPVTQADINGNRWFHLVAVQDAVAGQVGLYVNGQRAAEKKSIAGAAVTVPSSLQIGSRGATAVAANGAVTSSGTECFHGLIDEVALYGRALSASDIQAHYRLGTAGPSTKVITAP